MVGTLVSHYRVLEPLGAGGMGVLFKAEDVKLGRLVALKFLQADRSHDAAAADRFLREARAASALNHPHICTIYEVDEHEGSPFIAMELLEGQSLDKRIDGRPLDIAVLVRWAEQIADGLESAHVAGILHRDIKPANIFITSRDQAKVLDFGLAKFDDHSMSATGRPTEVLTTRQGVTMGTVAYMSPEQARGETLDARSDIFSFGLVLYEMATGRQTFQGGTTALVFDAILNREPQAPIELNANVPLALERVIGRALEKDRAARFASMTDLRAELAAISAARSSAAHTAVVSSAGKGAWPSSQAVPVAVPTTRSPRWVLAGAAAVLVVAAFWGVLGRRPLQTQEAVTTAVTEARPEGDSSPPIVSTAVAGTPANSASSPREATTPVEAVAAPIDPVAPNPLKEAAVARGRATGGPARLQAARAKLEARLFEQAIGDARDVIAAGPSSALPPARLLIGQAFERMGRSDDARAAYIELRTVHPLAPETASATLALTALVTRSKDAGRDEQARALLTELVGTFPRSPEAPVALFRRAALERAGRARVVDGEIGTSVPAELVTYRTLVRAYPRHAMAEAAYERLAELFEDGRRYEDAATTWALLGERFPSNRKDATWRAAELFREKVRDPVRARSAYAAVPVASERYDDAQKRLRP